MSEAALYREYEGTYSMRLHDGYDALRRWFYNWALEKYACGPTANEYLIIEEKSWTVRGRRIVQYIGTIGADHHNHVRRVLFEPGAPPPPTFMVPVKEKYVPPDRAAEARRMAQNLAMFDAMERTYHSRRYSPEQRFIADVLPPVAPLPPRYRRN